MAKILVVDDSEIARAELARPLKEAGFDITEADNGMTALQFVKDGKFDMVITDVHMPIMNGIEFCEAMRDEKIKNVPPIIVVSTEANPDMKVRGKAAGVKGWVIKPIDTQKLVQVCKKLIETKAP